jgi:hypothetical protein
MDANGDRVSLSLEAPGEIDQDGRVVGAVRPLEDTAGVGAGRRRRPSLAEAKKSRPTQSKARPDKTTSGLNEAMLQRGSTTDRPSSKLSEREKSSLSNPCRSSSSFQPRHISIFGSSLGLGISPSETWKVRKSVPDYPPTFLDRRGRFPFF